MGVAKELRKLCNEPLDGIKVVLNEEEVTDITAEIAGPGAPSIITQTCARLFTARDSTWTAWCVACQSPRRLLVAYSRSSLCCRRTTRRPHPRVPPPPPPSSHDACGGPQRPRPNQSHGPFAFAPGYFLTKIFHPNISKTGEICVNTLKKDWKADLGVGHVLQVRLAATQPPFSCTASRHLVVCAPPTSGATVRRVCVCARTMACGSNALARCGRLCGA